MLKLITSSRIFYRCVDWNVDYKGISFNFFVASFTDAWIETDGVQLVDNNQVSHLLQMRGLKPLFKGAFERVFNVASFTGTTIYNIFCKKITGLKYLFVRK